MIDGVQVIPLESHVDDRGYLIELVHGSDEFLPKFGQVYFVCSVARNTIRAFHKHEVLWDYFFISSGSAKFALRDDRPTSPTYEAMMTVVTGVHNPTLLVIPPGIFHGWMALEDNTHLISTASEEYNRENPDEVRVPPDSWAYDWKVHGR